MHLALGARRLDLATRALVMAVLDRPGDPVDDAADLVEVTGPGWRPGLPACMVAGDADALERALAAGASLVRLPGPSAEALRRCGEAAVAVVVPRGAAGMAEAAGLPPDRVVAGTSFVDVVAVDSPVAAAAVGIVRGGRVVRTAAADVGRVGRARDVLAAVLEAR